MIFSTPWTTQPPISVALNRSHRMARSLRHLWTFREGAGDQLVDFATLRQTDAITNPSWVVGPVGRGLDFDDTGSSYVTCPDSTLPANSDFTVVAIVATTGTDACDVISNNQSQTGRISLSPVRNSSAQLPSVFFSGSSGTMILDGSTAINDGQVHALACSRAGNTFSLAVDGVVEAQATNSSSIDQNTTYIGRRISGGSNERSLNGQLYLLAIYNRAFTSAEHRQFAANPWAMFQPRRLVLPVDSGGATSVAPWFFHHMINNRRIA